MAPNYSASTADLHFDVLRAQQEDDNPELWSSKVLLLPLNLFSCWTFHLLSQEKSFGYSFKK